jgi:preprotein translocase subunit SecD
MTNRRTSQKTQQQEKDIVKLQRLIKYAKTRKNQEVTEEERSRTNEQLKALGNKIGAKLPKLQRHWSHAWIEDIKGWQKLLQEKKKKNWEQAQRRRIEENIDKRCEMIKTDQGKMLASLLNKPYKKIVLDRLIKQEEEETYLITKPEEIKTNVVEHYRMQFRKRNTKLETMTEKWKEIYEPRESIKEEWYTEVEKEIKEKEWEEVLRELKTGTASGISGISYILIKKAGAKTQEVFRSFTDLCLEVGEIPMKWKIA